MDEALRTAREDDAPSVVLARTVKGKGVPEIEDKNGYHGKPLKPDVAERAIASLGGVRQLTDLPGQPERGRQHVREPVQALDPHECLVLGTEWVHLRLCLTWGHVGCCDSSPLRHARAHAHSDGHPIGLMEITLAIRARSDRRRIEDRALHPV